MERIYLDHNATTPPHPAVVEAMARALREGWGNASSIHAEGRAARHVVDEARDAVAAAVGVRTDQVTFTSGGTEADNLALLGTAAAWRATHPSGGHVVMTAIEHPAVLRCGLALERDGIAVTRLAPAPDGRVPLDHVTAAFRPDTFLVSVMAVNNETGAIQPFAEIGAACRARGILFHTDAVQGLAKVPLDLGRLPVDLCAISAHKIYGPKGVGALILRPGIALAARTHGGGQEDGRRTGTENVPGIAGFGAAARLVADGRLHDLAAIGRLRDHLWDGIHAAVPDARRNGDPAHTIATTLSVTFPGLASDALQLRLDLDGLAVSTGSACASGAPEPSHVLLAQGLSKADARGTVRLSLGRDNTPAQMDRAIAAIGKSVDALRALAGAKR